MKQKASNERAENRERYAADFHELRSILTSMPRFVIAELTRNCNLHCRMCREKRAYDLSLDMPWSLFRRVAEELFPSAEVVDLRGDGESTILPDFARYVEHTVSYGPRIRLCTNMTSSDAALWGLLMEAHCITAISFDGGTKRTYERIRRGASFADVTRNIRRVVSLNNHYGGNPMDIYLSVVVQGGNVDELPRIVSLSRDLGLSRIKLFPVWCSEEDPNHLSNCIGRLNQSLRATAEAAGSFGVRVEIGAALHRTHLIPDKQFPVCIHPWMYCHVSPDGRVGFCDHLTYYEQYSIGRLGKSCIAEIWNSADMIRVREEHLARKCCSSEPHKRTPVCDWCYKYRYTDTEDLFDTDSQRRVVLIQDIISLLS